MAKEQHLSDVCIHVITDGRDTPPTSGKESIRQLENYIAESGIGRIVTISGRYYSMDRDRRWDRVKLAYDVMTQDGEEMDEYP